MSDLTTKAAEIRAGLVKPLVWSDAADRISGNTYYSCAPTPLGDCWVSASASENWDAAVVGNKLKDAQNRVALYPSIDAAKAAAQSDYESGILSALNLDGFEQQAAELAEARAERDQAVERYAAATSETAKLRERVEDQREAIGRYMNDDVYTRAARAESRATTAKSERDELLREKERLGAAHQKWWKERGGIGVACFGSGHDQERAFAKTDKEFAFAVANALSALENGPAGLADAHSKPPAPSSQSERIAVREAVRKLTSDGKLSCWLDEDEHVETFEQIRAALTPLGEE